MSSTLPRLHAFHALGGRQRFTDEKCLLCLFFFCFSFVFLNNKRFVLFMLPVFVFHKVLLEEIREQKERMKMPLFEKSCFWYRILYDACWEGRTVP